MIYLDYAADTPTSEDVLKNFYETTKKYPANPNASHKLGKLAKEAINDSRTKVAELIGVRPEEVIYTSGATEANNMAIKGIANEYKNKGKHIITTYFEHASVNAPILYLKERGYEVDYVDILPSGKVDIQNLKELIREDTILVSVCMVDSEMGISQDISEISEVLKNYPNANFHIDATQAMGKTYVDCSNADLITFSPHKFYGLQGVGVLVKKQGINLSPLLHGGQGDNFLRGGTPTTALIISVEDSIKTALDNVQDNFNTVKELNYILRDEINKISNIKINSPEDASPYILNISIKDVKAKNMQDKLSDKDIYISTKSACTISANPSRSVMALYKDRKRALATLRISLSPMTTKEEILKFTAEFKMLYEELRQEK